MLFLNLSTRRPWAARVPVLAGVAWCGVWVLAATTACSSAGSSDSSEPNLVIDDPDEDPSIAFQPGNELYLLPGELAPLEVIVTPNLRQEVNFELLVDDPEFDGFLLESTARVREDGTAAVSFQAPSEAAFITIRATFDGEHFATREVTVGESGFGSVTVEPVYGGKREIVQWTASAFVGETCAERETYFVDSIRAATGSSLATITGVPTGVPVALTIRGEQLVSGCVTLNDLAPDGEEVVQVEVSDRPLDLQEGTLELSLGIDSSTTDFASHLEEVIASGSGYFWDNANTEGAALVGLMAQELSGSDKTDFNDSAETHGLGAALDAHFESNEPITFALRSILTDAADAISGDDVLLGELELAGDSSQFLLTEAAGVPAAVSGFLQGSRWTAAAESEDTLVLGGALTYEPIRWLVAIAEQNAADESSPQEIVVEAAACSEVAMTLVTAAGGDTHSDCGEECLTLVCENAVAPVWDNLRTAGSGLSMLQIAASGHSKLFGAARVMSVSGSWVGRIDGNETSIAGAMSGERLAEDAPE